MSLATTIRRRQSLIRGLARKGYRDAYVNQHIKRGLATQIRSMREDRGWTQAELGRRLGRKQPNIARLEDEDYGKYNLQTLQRIASAFDVALVVRFVSFAELVSYTSNITSADLAPPEFTNDIALRITLLVASPTSTVVPVAREGLTTLPRVAPGQLPLALPEVSVTPIDRYRSQGQTSPMNQPLTRTVVAAGEYR